VPKAIRALPGRRVCPARKVLKVPRARTGRTGCRLRRNFAWSVPRPRTVCHDRQCVASMKSWSAQLACRERARRSKRPRRSATPEPLAIRAQTNPISRIQSSSAQSGIHNDLATSWQACVKLPKNPWNRQKPGPRRRRLWPDRAGRNHKQIWRSSATHRMAFDRGEQRPARRAGIADGHDPPAGTIQPVHGLQPGIEQGVALSKRPNRFFDIVRAGSHALRLTKLRSKTVAPPKTNLVPARPLQMTLQSFAARSLGTKVRVLNLLARPPLAVKTRRMSWIAKGPFSDPLFKTSARADSQRRRSRPPRCRV
jgi:hypothetical protein